MEAHAKNRTIYRKCSVFRELPIIIALITTMQCHCARMCNALSGEHTDIFTSVNVNTDADV